MSEISVFEALTIEEINLTKVERLYRELTLGQRGMDEGSARVITEALQTAADAAADVEVSPNEIHVQCYIPVGWDFATNEREMFYLLGSFAPGHRITDQEADYIVGIECATSFLMLLTESGPCPMRRTLNLPTETSPGAGINVSLLMHPLEIKADKQEAMFKIDVSLQCFGGAYLSQDVLTVMRTLSAADVISEPTPKPSASGEIIESRDLLSPEERDKVAAALIQVPNTIAYRKITDGMSKGTLFSRSDPDGYPAGTIDHPGFSLTVQMRPHEEHFLHLTEEARERSVRELWQEQKKWNDWDADTFDYMMSRPIEYGRAARYPGSVSELCKLRGYQKKLGGSGRRGGYHDEFETKQRESIARVNSLVLSFVQKKGKNPKRIDSRAVVITDLEGQTRIDNTVEFDKFLFAIGAVPESVFLRSIDQGSPQFALLSLKAFQYNSHGERWEKWLCRYFTWMWRIKLTDHPTYRVTALLEEVFEKPDLYKSRRRDQLFARFIKALNRLKNDGVISGFIPKGWKVENPNYNDWLSGHIIILAPPVIREQYSRIQRKGQDTPKALGSGMLSIQEKVVSTMNRLGLKQKQIAEESGVDPTLLSKILNGKREPTRQTAILLNAWVERYSADAGAPDRLSIN
jgi:hypothetical protein